MSHSSLQIKVGMLVSYDYQYLKYSLPPVYEYADRIVLAVDKDNKTWAGNDIYISGDFWQWLKDFDQKNKIEIYRDSFYEKDLTAMQCETRERNMLAKYMGDGGWHIQLDSDEYFVDFKHFVDFLCYVDKKKKYIDTVGIEWLFIYKKTLNGYLVINETTSTTPVPLATKKPRYLVARQLAKSRTLLYPQRLIHDSWARTEQELWQKLTNWGHNCDFDTEGYFHFWKAIDEKNYMFVRNFHITVPDYWQSLFFIKAGNIEQLLMHIRSNEDLKKQANGTTVNLQNT